MHGKKKKYDLVCSLGGNCAAAHNLLFKGLREEAYPFDWTYFNSDEAVYKLIEGFKDGFKNYALIENFKELPINNAHPEKIQYEDTYAKIIWANHFYYNEDKLEGYKRVKEVLDRRFQRLINSIKKFEKILFIFSTYFQIKPDSFLYLIDNLNTIYPNKIFDIKVLSFNADKNYVYKKNNIEICYYERKMNNDDFAKTNKEWEFLDEICIIPRFSYFIKIIKKSLINVIPIKSLRHELRRKIHV